MSKPANKKSQKQFRNETVARCAAWMKFFLDKVTSPSDGVMKIDIELSYRELTSLKVATQTILQLKEDLKEEPLS